jgi:cysteinyl-tRNA synthetase
MTISTRLDLVREINRGNEKGLDIRDAQDTLRELAGVIGFTLQETKKVSAGEEQEIEALIAKRNEYRRAKEWKQADEVRDRLLKMGVAIEDTAKGTIWKISR